MPRRSKSLVTARVQPPPVATNGNGHAPTGKLIDSTAIQVLNNDRMLFQLWGQINPSELTSILRQALIGNLVWQERLFQKMIDEWPRLQKNLLSLKRDVADIGWSIQPYADKGEEPSALAQEKASLVERALFGMVGDPTLEQSDFSGLIKDLVDAVPMCFSINEITWTVRDGEIVPQCTRKIPARFYGYGLSPDKPDQLMLNPLGNLSLTSESLESFPPNKFLIGVFKANNNHPSTAAMLRALTPWWFASKYGLKWFMTFCQMFGTPMRMAEYTPGDTETFNQLCSMLEQMGFANWGVFPTGAKVELLESKSTGGTMLPQRVLLNDADEQCDVMILGQTLTSHVSGAGGNRALGQVHADTEIKVLNGVSDFIESVINTQLIPAIISLNYGETSELPYIQGSMEEPADELVLAQRDQILTQIGLPLAKDFLYERHSIPEPSADAELLEVPAPPAPFGGGAPDDAPGKMDLNEPPTPPNVNPVAKVANASDAGICTPSMQMATAVKRGLDLRKKTGRGGSLSAVTRARDIGERKPLPVSTVKRMQIYFDSHAADAKADPQSAAGIAWALHGGNAGRAWVEQVVKGT